MWCKMPKMPKMPKMSKMPKMPKDAKRCQDQDRGQDAKTPRRQTCGSRMVSGGPDFPFPPFPPLPMQLAEQLLVVSMLTN